MWTTSFLLANIQRLFTVGNHEEIIGNTKTLDWCLIPVGTVLFVPIIFEVQCPWNRPSIANILVIQAKCTTSTPFHQESTKKPPRIICSVSNQKCSSGSPRCPFLYSLYKTYCSTIQNNWIRLVSGRKFVVRTLTNCSFFGLITMVLLCNILSALG